MIYDIEVDLDDPALMRAKVCALMAEHTEGHGFVRRPADRLISE